MQIGFKKVHPDAQLPAYAHEGDAGMDVCAAEEVLLKPYTPTIVKTGLSAEIPMGYEIQVRSRSGLAAKHAIFVLNGIGTIDSGFKGQIGVILFWAPSPKDAFLCSATCLVDNDLGWVIQKGDRIAQLVVAPVTKCEPIEISEVSETERGAGGFGSTGI